MGIKTLKTIVQLRRDNDYNFERIKDKYIPLNGEVVLVDTAQSGLRFKVGDGIKTYAQLDYADKEASVSILRGYYFNGDFYADSAHTELLPARTDLLYIEASECRLYIYTGDNYEAITEKLPNASSQQAGIMKLYDTLGYNTDGAPTQRVVTEALNTKIEVRVNEDDETIILSSNIFK